MYSFPMCCQPKTTLSSSFGLKWAVNILALARLLNSSVLAYNINLHSHVKIFVSTSALIEIYLLLAVTG